MSLSWLCLIYPQLLFYFSVMESDGDVVDLFFKSKTFKKWRRKYLCLTPNISLLKFWHQMNHFVAFCKMSFIFFILLFFACQKNLAPIPLPSLPWSAPAFYTCIKVVWPAVDKQRRDRLGVLRSFYSPVKLYQIRRVRNLSVCPPGKLEMTE